MSGGVIVRPNDPLIRHFVGVYVTVKGQQASVCTGTIVGSRTVLTAAHCFKGDPKETSVYVMATHEPYRVLTNHFRLGQAGPILKAKGFEIYEKFKSAKNLKEKISSDVAVIHFESTNSWPRGFEALPLITPYTLSQLPEGLQVYSVGHPDKSNFEVEQQIFKKDNFSVIKNMGAALEKLLGLPLMRVSDGVLDHATEPANPYFVVQSLPDEKSGQPRSELLPGDSGSSALANIFGIPKVIGVFSHSISLDEKLFGFIFTNINEPQINLWIRNRIL